MDAENINGGWISIYRCLLKKAIWQTSTPEQKVILITLLLMANHEEKEWEWEGKKFIVPIGGMITSLESIKKNAGKNISFQNIRTALARFEKYEFLTNKSTKTGRLIIINNFEEYQGELRKVNIKNKKTNKGINKQVTNRSQTGNKELTPNNNDNKYNNDNNDNNKEEIYKEEKIKYADYVSLTVKEYQKLIDKYGEDNTKKMITILDNYKGAKPNKRKYESDYRAILSWVAGKVTQGDNNKINWDDIKLGGD